MTKKKLTTSKAKKTSKPGIPGPALIGIAICLFLIFGNGQGCVISKPPIPVTGIKGAVVVGIDGSPESLKAMTDNYPGVLGDIQAKVIQAGYLFRLLDFNKYKDSPPTDDDAAVQAAWKAMDRTKPPRIIGATPNSGFPDQPLPKTTAEADKLLLPILK